jgi:hypothetical protein
MNFIQRFIHAATLDIFETYPNACHEPLSNNFELFLNKTRWRKSRLSIVWQVYYFAGLTSLYWLRKRFNKRPIVGGDIVFLWQTENQKNSLSPIEKEINSRHPTAVVDDQSLGFITRSATTYLLSLFFFPVCIFQYLKSTGYQRKTFPLVFDRYLLGYGVYFRLSRWFEKGAPKAIVIANDHSQFPCLVVAAAKASNVPTFYVQHACVTDRFPKLIFDYALLDGMDAEAKYLAAGKSDTDIRLIGPSRLDGYVDHINNNRDVSSIGVCFSLSDDESRINELLEMLVELNGFSISLRPHYRMSQAFHNRIKEFANLNGFTYSEHKTVPALQFMKSIDLLIAGVSAITMGHR